SIDLIESDADVTNFTRAHRLLATLQNLLTTLLLVFGEHAAEFGESSLRILDQAGKFVIQIQPIAHSLVLFGRVLRFHDNSLDLVLGQTRSGRDAHCVLAASRLVSSRDGNDAVGVDLERYFNLRNATGRRRDAHQFELAEAAVSV